MLNRSTQQVPNMGDDQTPSEVMSVYSQNQSNYASVQATAPQAIIQTQIPVDPIQRIKNKNNRSITTDVMQIPTVISSIEQLQNYNHFNNGIKHPNNSLAQSYNQIAAPIQIQGINQQSDYKKNLPPIQSIQSINMPSSIKNSNQHSPRSISVGGITPIVHCRVISTNSINSVDNSQLKNILPIYSQNAQTPIHNIHNSHQPLFNSNLNTSGVATAYPQNVFSQTQIPIQTPAQNSVQQPQIATALTLSGNLNDRNCTPPAKISFSKQQSIGTTDLYQSNDNRSNSVNQTKSQLLSIKISQYGKVMNAKDDRDIPQNPLKKIIQKPLLNKTSSGIFDSQSNQGLPYISQTNNNVPPMLPIIPTGFKNSSTPIVNRVNNHIQQPLVFQIQSSQSVSPMKKIINNSIINREKDESPEKLLTTIKPYVSINNSTEFKPIQKMVINIPPNHPMHHQFQQNQQKLTQTINDAPSTLQQPVPLTQIRSTTPPPPPPPPQQLIQQNKQQQVTQTTQVIALNSQQPVDTTKFTFFTQSSPAAASLNIHQLNQTPQTLFSSTQQRVASINSLNCFQSSNQFNNIDNIAPESKYNNSENDEPNSSKINAVIKPSQITKKEQIDQLLQSNDSPQSDRMHSYQLSTPNKKEQIEFHPNLEPYSSNQANTYQFSNNKQPIPNCSNTNQPQDTIFNSQLNLSPNKQEYTSANNYKNAQIHLRNTVDQLKNIIKPIQSANNSLINNSQPVQPLNIATELSNDNDILTQKTQIYQKRLLTINTQIDEIKKKNEDSTKNIGITISDLLKNEVLIEKQLADYKEHQSLVGQKLLELDERIQKQTQFNNQYLENSPPSDKLNQNEAQCQQEQPPQLDKNDKNTNLDNIIEERSDNYSESEGVKRTHKSTGPIELNTNDEQINQQIQNNSSSFGQPQFKEATSYLVQNQSQIPHQNEQFTLQPSYNPQYHQIQETTSYLISNDSMSNIVNQLNQSQGENRNQGINRQQSDENIIQQLTLGNRSYSQGGEDQQLRQSTHQNANAVNLNAILRKQNSSSSNSPSKVNEGSSPLRRLNNELKKSISELQGKKTSSPLHKLKQNITKNQFEFQNNQNDISNSDANQKSSLLLFKANNDSSLQLFSQASSENVDNIPQSKLVQSGNLNGKNNNILLNNNTSKLYPIPESKPSQTSTISQANNQINNNTQTTPVQKKLANSNLKNNHQSKNLPIVASSRDSIIQQFQYLSGLTNKELSPNTKTIKQSSLVDKSLNEQSFTTEKQPNSNTKQVSQTNINDTSLTSSHLKRPTKSTFTGQTQKQSLTQSQKKQPTIKKDLKIETDLEKIKSVINKSQTKVNTTSAQVEKMTTPNTKILGATHQQQNIQIEEINNKQINQKQQQSVKSNTPKFSESKNFSVQIQQEQQSNKSDTFGQQMAHQEDSMIIPINLKEQLQNQDSNQKSNSKRPSRELNNQQQFNQEQNNSLNQMTFNGQQLLEKIQNHLGININNQQSNNIQNRTNQALQEERQQKYNQEEEEEEDYREQNLEEGQNEDADQYVEVKLNNYYSQPQINNYQNSQNQNEEVEEVSQSVNTNQFRGNGFLGNDNDEENLYAALNDLNSRLYQKSIKLTQSQLNTSQKYLSRTPERAVTETQEDFNWQTSYSHNKGQGKSNKDRLNKSVSQEKKNNLSNSQSPMKGSYIQNQQHQQQLMQSQQQQLTEHKKNNKNNNSPNQKMVSQELKRIFDVYSQNSKNENSKTLQEMQQILFKSAKQQSYDSTQSPVKQPQYIQNKGVGGSHKKNNSMNIKQFSYKDDISNKQQLETSINNTGMEDSQVPKAKKTYSGMHFKKQVYTIVKDVEDQHSHQNLQTSQIQKKISKEQNNNMDPQMKERSFEFWAEKIKNSDNPKQILDVWKMINSANKQKQ